MSYSAYLKPRQEAISDPTTDVIKVLDAINVRFSFSNESSGLFLFEGLKGIGPGNAFRERPGGFERRHAAGYSFENLQARQKCHSPCERDDKQVWRAQWVDDGNI